VKVADVTVLLVRTRGPPVAAPLAARRVALQLPVVGRELPAAAAGDGFDGRLVVRVDGWWMMLKLE
jgi:hypothetical protein